MNNSGEQSLHYNIKKWKKFQFYILRDISRNTIFVQLIVSVGNINNAVSILGYCIFDSNCKNSLLLALYLLNLICSPLEVEGTFSMFETVFQAFRYINNTEKLNISDYWITDWWEEIHVENEWHYVIITDVTCIYI